MEVFHFAVQSLARSNSCAAFQIPHSIIVRAGQAV